MPETAHTEAKGAGFVQRSSFQEQEQEIDKIEVVAYARESAVSPNQGKVMDNTNVPLPLLPAHIEETIRSLARLHAEHHQKATPLQRTVDRVTAFLGRPRFIGILTIMLGSWISLNLVAGALGFRPFDSPPFPWMEAGVSLTSLYMVVLILVTQRREDKLAELREQLNLELAILSEQKTAKVIQLLEEFRRDSPLMRDRIDHQAESMAQPSDPQTVLDAIKETHAEAEQIRGSADGH